MFEANFLDTTKIGGT